MGRGKFHHDETASVMTEVVAMDGRFDFASITRAAGLVLSAGRLTADSDSPTAFSVAMRAYSCAIGQRFPARIPC
jgi:hypothetical protein